MTNEIVTLAHEIYLDGTAGYTEEDLRNTLFAFAEYIINHS